MSAGAVLAVDPAGTPESVTVTAVGTAAATATTLPAGAKAGDTNLKVASVAGMTVGHLVRVDAGASIEVPTVAAVGTAASTATTLAAAAAAGATNIKVTSVTGMTAGHQIRVDTGANLEVDTIAAVGTAGSAGTGITLTAPLVSAHATGAAAQDLGTGVTLTAPLAVAHAAGAAAQDLGTGVTITPALTAAHAQGQAVSVRVGIPAYGWWNEALHGVSRESTAAAGNAVNLTNTTSYPIDQSLGASWDPELMHRVASAISDESREVVRNNKLDLDFYSPTMNLQRDPRWGRNDESYGRGPAARDEDGRPVRQRHGGQGPERQPPARRQRLLQDDDHDQALRDEQQRGQPPRRARPTPTTGRFASTTRRRSATSSRRRSRAP